MNRIMPQDETMYCADFARNNKYSSVIPGNHPGKTLSMQMTGLCKHRQT